MTTENECPNLIAALSRKVTPALTPLDAFFADPLWVRVLRTDIDAFIKSYAEKQFQA